MIRYALVARTMQVCPEMFRLQICVQARRRKWRRKQQLTEQCKTKSLIFDGFQAHSSNKIPTILGGQGARVTSISRNSPPPEIWTPTTKSGSYTCPAVPTFGQTQLKHGMIKSSVGGVIMDGRTISSLGRPRITDRRTRTLHQLLR